MPAPKPLSNAAVKKLEAAGTPVWRTRTGEAFQTRKERRTWRKAAKAK